MASTCMMAILPYLHLHMYRANNITKKAATAAELHTYADSAHSSPTSGLV